MFDSLFASIPDTSFFAQHDFAGTIREEYLDSDIPFGCLARGPAHWDPHLHPEFPVYALCKTNNEDNKDFIPFRDAVLVVSSIETGECKVNPMQEDEGKMPLFGRKPPSRPNSNLPIVKSYSVREIWRALAPNELPEAPGAYVAYVHSGNFQSLPFSFHIDRESISHRKNGFEKLLEAEHDPVIPSADSPRVRFESLSEASSPSVEGLDFSVAYHQGRDSHDLALLHASFRFLGKWLPSWRRIPIHFLVSVPGSSQPLLQTIWFPRKYAHIDREGYSGAFRFDLAGLFTLAPGEKPKIPESVWIGSLHRGWQGQLKRVDFQSTLHRHGP